MKTTAAALVMLALGSAFAACREPAAPRVDVAVDGLRLQVPQTWKAAGQPSGDRLGEWIVPGDARLTVHRFAPNASAPEAVFAAFAQQFEPPAAANAKTSARRFPGRPKLTVFDVRGTWLGDANERRAGAPARPDHRMTVACVHVPNGNRFVAFVGPAASIDAMTGEVDAVLASLRD